MVRCHFTRSKFKMKEIGELEANLLECLCGRNELPFLIEDNHISPLLFGIYVPEPHEY